MYIGHMTATQQVSSGSPTGLGQVVIRDLWIPGRPKPKGSLKNVAKRGQPARMVEQVEGSTEWKRRVRNAVTRHVLEQREREGVAHENWRPITAAVEVTAWFYFTPPASPVNADYPCGQEGDTDKLCRNIGDALQESDLIRDDRQITDWVARKRFQDEDNIGEGVLLSVRILP